VLNEWGPKILVCLTVVLGIVYQNARMSDFRSEINARLSDFRSHLDGHIDDLRDLVKSEIARVEKRIEARALPPKAGPRDQGDRGSAGRLTRQAVRTASEFLSCCYVIGVLCVQSFRRKGKNQKAKVRRRLAGTGQRCFDERC